MTTPIDMGGITLTVNDIKVGAATPGAAGTSSTLTALTGVTPGTGAASKAVVLDANKDFTAFRNVSATGTMNVTTPTGSIGYVTGAGGAITQSSTISTGVTLSTACGQITTVSASTAAGAEDQFTVTNTNVLATDVIPVTTTYAGAGTPLVYVSKVAAGSFQITISNLHASAALNAALVINFVRLVNSAS